MNPEAIRLRFCRAGALLAVIVGAVVVAPTWALADPFVGKEWHIRWVGERLPHVFFPSSHGWKTFKVLETHQGRWYQIEFQIPTSAYEFSGPPAPGHLRGTTQTVWVNADQILSFSEPMAEAPKESPPPPSDVAPPAGGRARPRGN
jgi:hypothetical protein